MLYRFEHEYNTGIGSPKSATLSRGEFGEVRVFDLTGCTSDCGNIEEITSVSITRKFIPNDEDGCVCSPSPIMDSVTIACTCVPYCDIVLMVERRAKDIAYNYSSHDKKLYIYVPKTFYGEDNLQALFMIHLRWRRAVRYVSNLTDNVDAPDEYQTLLNAMVLNAFYEVVRNEAAPKYLQLSLQSESARFGLDSCILPPPKEAKPKTTVDANGIVCKPCNS